jgi:multiple sugar transport system ATP-binding protein
MASVTYDHVWKKYGDVVAVQDLHLAIEDKEFLVLVGPPAAEKPRLCAVWLASKKSLKVKF